MMYRFLTLVCVIVSFVIVGCQPKVDRSSFIPEELEFLKKYPEVELSQIPVEWRGIFMAGYEEYHPVLDGRDVIFLSSEQEIATMKDIPIERLEEVKVYNDTFIKIRVKNVGRSGYKQITYSFYKGYIHSFLKTMYESENQSNTPDN